LLAGFSIGPEFPAGQHGDANSRKRLPVPREAQFEPAVSERELRERFGVRLHCVRGSQNAEEREEHRCLTENIERENADTVGAWTRIRTHTEMRRAHPSGTDCGSAIVGNESATAWRRSGWDMWSGSRPLGARSIVSVALGWGWETGSEIGHDGWVEFKQGD
jgi:hypothetical protein